MQSDGPEQVLVDAVGLQRRASVGIKLEFTTLAGQRSPYV